MTEPTRPRLEVGDPLPGFALPDQNGINVPILHASLAGDPIVLLLLPTPGDPAAQAALAALEQAAMQAEGRPIHALALSSWAPDQNRALAEKAGFTRHLLADAAGVLPRFGLTAGDAPVAVVIRQSGRIEALIADPAAAVRTALALLPAGPGPIAGRQAPVLVVEEIFPHGYCEKLIRIWHDGAKEADRITGSSGDYAAAKTKRRADHIIRDPALSREIQGYFVRRLVPELVRAFQFRLLKAEPYRIGCYDAEAGGYFRRHRDTFMAANAHRRFALSLNLNTGDYEGGELVFAEFGPARFVPPKGGGVVFSCSLLHEAMPVTRGRRFALFTFFSGEIVQGTT